MALLPEMGNPFDSYEKHDTELGWIPRANVHIPNRFGRWKDVSINSQNLRASREFDRDVPVGQIRVVCSGDSMTFGLGVGNAETWCEQLALFDPRIEPLNAAALPTAPISPFYATHRFAKHFNTMYTSFRSSIPISFNA